MHNMLSTSGVHISRLNLTNTLGVSPRFKLIIPEMKFEVCSPCQNHCRHCAHKELMASNADFHLSIEDLTKFIDCTKRSGYFIKDLSVHGPGEPTLWRNLNEGIKLLHNSGVVGNIILTSNGHSLNRLNEESWNYISWIELSSYPDVKVDVSGFKSKLRINPKEYFKKLPDRKYENTIPCRCLCPGPMFMKDKIFLTCGPPVFDAALLSGDKILEQKDLFVPLSVNYMDKFDFSKIGTIKFCEYCFANANLHSGGEVHAQEERK